MSFASVEFLPFLALVVALFAFVPKSARTLFLLLASYVFYLYSEPLHGLLIAGSTVVDYAVGRALGRTQDERKRRVLLSISLVLNIGVLALFKYSSFFVESLNPLLSGAGLETLDWPKLALPLGISFYTFQTLAYTIDVYRGTISPCRNFTSFALYVSFFPQLIAGPIERAGHLIPQLERSSALTVERLGRGGQLILWGLVKKLLFADHMAAHVRPVFGSPEAHGTLSLVLAAVAMNVVLYLDFSAYTDIARGAARIFGVDLVQNFRRPFMSRSLGEFASRWHISLFRWIGDYVYAPLSGGKLRHWRLWRNNCLTMTLFGFWHGASWTFLLWGLSSGVAISVQQSLRLRGVKRGVIRRPSSSRWSALDVAACLGTTLLTSAFVVFFFSPDLDFALRWYVQLASFAGDSNFTWIAWTSLVLLLGMAGQATAEFRDLEVVWAKFGWLGRALVVGACLLALLFLRVPHAEDFIYFRF